MLRAAGVYGILHVANNQIYVGGSTNVYKRVDGSKKRLREGAHHNRYLQNSWNKYGEQAFEFKILKECTIAQCFLYEQVYINCCVLLGLKMYNSAFIVTQCKMGLRARLTELWYKTRALHATLEKEANALKATKLALIKAYHKMRIELRAHVEAERSAFEDARIKLDFTRHQLLEQSQKPTLEQKVAVDVVLEPVECGAVAGCNVFLTPIEQAMYDLLKDSRAHTIAELLNCLEDPQSSAKNVHVHLCSLRKKLRVTCWRIIREEGVYRMRIILGV